MNPSAAAIVTGGTSGIGLCTARALAAAGYQVYTFSRRGTGPAGMTHLSVDVADEVAVRAAVDRVAAEAGGLDLVVNCAGFGISGAVEFTDTQAAQRLFDVNFFGMVRVNRAALPHLRKRKGRIINISSVAAPVAIPFQAYYSCTKAAVNDYTLALANEVKPFGVSVCAVMPGDIRTGFTAAREKETAGDGIYQGRIARSVARMEHDEETGMSPEKAGAYICKIARKKRVKGLYAIGFVYQFFCFLAKVLPVRLLYWIVGQLYAK